MSRVTCHHVMRYLLGEQACLMACANARDPHVFRVLFHLLEQHENEEGLDMACMGDPGWPTHNIT